MNVRMMSETKQDGVRSITSHAKRSESGYESPLALGELTRHDKVAKVEPNIRTVLLSSSSLIAKPEKTMCNSICFLRSRTKWSNLLPAFPFDC